MIGTNFPYRALSPSGAFYMSDIENKFLEEGKLFGVSKRFTVAGAGTARIVLDPSGFDGTALLMFGGLFKGFGAGPLYIDLYEGVGYTGGTDIGVIAFNRRCSEDTAMTATLNPTITDTGTKLPIEYAVFSDTSGGGANTTRVGGEAAASNLPFDIDTTKPWMYEIKNQDTNDTAYCSFVTDWVEIT